MYQLIQFAETSYYLRDVQSQHEIGLMLRSFGYPFNQIGKFYESIYLFRSGQLDKARKLLECVADSAPAQYRSKALLSLAAVAERIGQFEESLRLRLQVPPIADPVTLLEAQRGIAARRGIEGEHGAALRELERMIPLAHIIGRRGHPAYYGFLNSYAVELSESGRTEEALQAMNVIAATPFINRFPECQETLSEILSKRKRSSTIAVGYPNLEVKVIYDSRVRAAINYMKDNLQRAAKLDEIAKAVGLSQTHLSRVFREQVGISPGEFQIRLKIQTAQELLASKSLSVKQVMTAVGYENRGNFIRQFTRLCKKTPTAYRRHIRLKPV